MTELKSCPFCDKCGKKKDIVVIVDGIPYCEDCFDEALEGVTNDA